MTKIRLLLVDDHPMVSEGLRVLLSSCDDMEVIGEARDGSQALDRVGELRPDIVIMDVAMPTMNGIEATGLIRQRYPDTRVLILTQHEERQYILPLIQSGASGIVLKKGLVADLVKAIRVVAQGETFIYPEVATIIVEEIKARPQLSPRGRSSLTPREQEILERIVMGETNAEIAVALFVSIKTVQFHRANLMEKLQVHTVADLVRDALRYGLVEMGPNKPARGDARMS